MNNRHKAKAQRVTELTQLRNRGAEFGPVDAVNLARKVLNTAHQHTVGVDAAFTV